MGGLVGSAGNLERGPYSTYHMYISDCFSSTIICTILCTLFPLDLFTRTHSLECAAPPCLCLFLRPCPCPLCLADQIAMQMQP